MDYEVEQKFRLDDVAALTKRVAELGATFSDPIVQSDTYYAHPVRDFAQTDEALRIRSIGNDHFITYKGPKIDQQTKTRRELELPLAVPDDQFGELLIAVGFRVVATVVKSRRKAKLKFEDLPFEIDMDNVTDVGTFAEIETIANESQLASATAKLNQLAEHLRLDDVVRSSYLEMLLGDEESI